MNGSDVPKYVSSSWLKKGSELTYIFSTTIPLACDAPPNGLCLYAVPSARLRYCLSAHLLILRSLASLRAALSPLGLHFPTEISKRNSGWRSGEWRWMDGWIERRCSTYPFWCNPCCFAIHHKAPVAGLWLSGEIIWRAEWWEWNATTMDCFLFWNYNDLLRDCPIFCSIDATIPEISFFHCKLSRTLKMRN